MTTQRRGRTPPDPRVLDGQPAALIVVGIGASAGGLKALQQFVEAVPAESGMAFVVIVHLDPERESRMAELLQDRSVIPVTQVTGPTAVEENHIYIIPPGQDLEMQSTTIALRDRGERSGHAPVDLFFRTLADAFGQDAIGVVLSGTGADGADGIRYIRQAGGITVAQSPDEAEHDGMPTSAIATGHVDLVLPSGRIPEELLRLRHPPIGTRYGSGATAETELGPILQTLRRRTGHDFSLYKQATVVRRLERRLRFNDVRSPADYLELLQSSAAESQALLRDMLISVSSFFRDPEAYKALEKRTPLLFEGKGPTDTVRVWVVGCATGEEVYSVAMVLAEYAATLSDPPQIQMFATDIDEKSYAWGRAGVYTAAAVAKIPPERLKRFFTKESSGYRIAKSLRDMVLFAGHNVLHDPPFSRMDLITCRNVFIYLKSEAQEWLLETFHFALNRKGLLLLGTSESTGGSALFVEVDGGSQRLYRRSSAATRPPGRLSAADPLRFSAQAASGSVSQADVPKTPFSYGALHVRMVEEYAPASVVVNDRLDVVHLSAGAGRYLRLGGGQPTTNLLRLSKEDLRRVLRTSLHHAFAKGMPTTRRVRMSVDGAWQQIRVQVRPSEVDGDAGRFALVVFEADESESVAGALPVQPEGASAAEVELEDELRRTRDLLESTIAAHDRTIAELQTVNEELLSINEEQRAATEELETGREEIQSINEELTTINQEYQSTIEELKRTNADLQNLIESTEIGTIFLNRAMRIRRFTPAIAALFNFVATDQGRPFPDITHRLKYPELISDVKTVLISLERLEREVESDTGRSYIVRINPYHSLDGGSDGVVLTFFDNTVQHRIEQQLREATLVAENANLAKGAFMTTLSHEFRTPLNAILGFADLLDLENGLTVVQNARVARIRAGALHLSSMIDEILSFAKLDGGHEVVQSERVDARMIAHEASALIESAAGAKGLEFVLDLPAAPVNLMTDRAKARQILINLCGNAVKFTHEGEVRLGVQTEGDRVTFEVRDTGMGIAPEYQQQIFERFWQVRSGSLAIAGGLGIGLAAAREYARLLGGDVQVSSELGIGSVFHFWLPGST
jgi:two-component system CheB/CheR fusion protein